MVEDPTNLDAAIGPTPVEVELERLLAGLPETLEDLLDHPSRSRPAVVEGLIAKGLELLAERRSQALAVAGAARRVAAELPEHWPQAVRLALRARSLELWGTLRRVAEDGVSAEAALLAAFELMARGERADPRQVAVVLGRCALLATELGREQDLERYAAEAARVTWAADDGWPLPTFLHLWRTVMRDPASPAAATRLAQALFRATVEAWGGFEQQPWDLSLQITDLGGDGHEIRLERQGPLAGLPGSEPDEPLVHRCH